MSLNQSFTLFQSLTSLVPKLMIACSSALIARRAHLLAGKSACSTVAPKDKDLVPAGGVCETCDEVAVAWWC